MGGKRDFDIEIGIAKRKSVTQDASENIAVQAFVWPHFKNVVIRDGICKRDNE